MPLARYALYAQRPEIYVAPTWDTGDSWLATMRHIAREAGAWVIGCATPLAGRRHPRRLPAPRPAVPRPRRMDQRRRRGGAAGRSARRWPARCTASKGLLWAEIDPAAVDAARRSFDAAGHYARPDVFTLTVDRTAARPGRLHRRRL